jgi:hypothetical protein
VSKLTAKKTATRGLIALMLVALGLVVALAGSSSRRSLGSDASQRNFQRLSAGGAVQASSARGSSTVREIKHGNRVAPAVFKGSVRNLPRVPDSAPPPERKAGLELVGTPKEPLRGAVTAPKAVNVPTAPAPDPTVTFVGLNKATNGAGWPPDTVGDVGPDHFVQAVNTSVGIYSKTGTQLAAFTFNSLWSGAGTGTLCDNTNRGDPTVIYDPKGGRWFVADFAFSGGGTTPPFYECIAVSKTSDPVNGGWYLYPIRADDAAHPWLPDYPKMGIWPDGLYMTANMFSASAYEEVRVWALNRSDLEAGVPVRSVVVDLGTPNYFSLMPSNMRTAAGAPPEGRNNLLVSESQSLFAFEVWKFHADYSGSGSTFTGPTNLSQTAYDFNPSDIPTPANALDSLFDRVMMQLQYSNIGGSESLWVNHTVHCCGAGTPMAIQWAQLNVTGGTVAATPVQQQIYPSVSDTLHRWMGSLAVDQNGDMALGYSIANATTNPDIRYAGRLVGDTLSTLPQTETTMLSGVALGSQSGSCGGSTCDRWGDYSAMTLDPDGCRFWYTQEYFGTTGLNWLTRIGSFSFPSCTAKSYQTISFGALAGKAFGDPDFSVSATASSGLAVTFSASGSCSVVGSTVHLTGSGSCTITASQVGDSTHASAPEVSRTFSIATGNQAITFGALAAKTFGDADFAVSANASSGLTVSFAATGSCTVSGATVHLTAPGSCTVKASQAGNANFNAATDVAQTFTVAKAAQTITFGALASKTFGDADFAVSASASSALAVSFAVTGSCALTGSTVHISGAGSCTVMASQPGDASYAAASDVSQTFTVARANQAITFAPLANKTLGTADFGVSATASSTLPVSFTASGSCTVSGATVHLTGAGSCSVTALQPGDANYNAATGVTQSFTVTKPPAKCTVAKVVGKSLAAAKRALTARHCRTGGVSYAYSRTVARGKVVAQSRRPGKVLPANTRVSLVVSRGRRP